VDAIFVSSKSSTPEACLQPGIEAPHELLASGIPPAALILIPALGSVVWGAFYWVLIVGEEPPRALTVEETNSSRSPSPAMAIGSNPLSSTRKSAQNDVISYST
jgi:hypothetical protein